jgi:hypothetical protein
MRGEKAQLSIEDGKNRGEKKIDAAVINKSHYCVQPEHGNDLH